MKKQILFLWAFVLAGNIFAQELPHFSNYMLHPLQINPAYMGTYTDIKGSFVYKKQWTGFEGAPTINAFDIGIPFRKTNSAIGLDFIDDQIGVNSNQQISLNYSYNLKVATNKHLAFGVSFALRLMKSELTDIQTQQTGDPQFMTNTPTFTVPNFKFGVYYFTNGFYAGLSIPDILDSKIIGNTNLDYESNSSFSLSQSHFYLHSGIKKQLTDEVEIHPSVLIKYIKGSPVQIDINADFTFKKLMGLGVSYRTRNALALLVHYRLNDYILLAYSYSYNFSNLNLVGSNSHEISVIYSLGKKGRFRIDTPRF